MTLTQILETKRSTIVDRWRTLVVGSYPPAAARLLNGRGDQFHNPVGHAIGASVAEIFDGVIADRPVSELREAVDRVVRIRAVQDFTPSEAVSFVLQLKAAVREQIDAQHDELLNRNALDAFDSRVDELALLAFDVYASCREQILAIRTKALERRTSHLIKLAERLGDIDCDVDAEAACGDEPIEGGPRA